jgi:hypothetical protein
MYYAERALQMMEQAKGNISACGCANSEEKNYQAIQSLDKAISPYDWEAGRFYSKKALAEIQELITALDLCSNEAYEEPVLEQQESTVQEESNNARTVLLNTQKQFDALEVSVQTLLDTLTSDDANEITDEKQLIADRTKKLLEEALTKLQNNN